jgi:hypothetical protein
MDLHALVCAFLGYTCINIIYYNLLFNIRIFYVFTYLKDELARVVWDLLLLWKIYNIFNRWMVFIEDEFVYDDLDSIFGWSVASIDQNHIHKVLFLSVQVYASPTPKQYWKPCYKHHNHIYTSDFWVFDDCMEICEY